MSRLFHLRRAGAALAIAGLFGAVAAAPLAVPGAFAMPAADGKAHVFQVGTSQIKTTHAHTTQVHRTVAGNEPLLDVSVSEAEELSGAGAAPVGAQFSLNDFLFRGVINWGGYKFTFYSQQVLPGGGLAIPGRHVNAGGYVSDADGYIVLAGSAPKGTVYDTPFGYPGKIYDRGTVGNHLDVYIR